MEAGNVVPNRSDQREFVEALARGLDIIRAFHAHKPLRTVSDLAAELNLARPTVHRILQTLEQLGYVVQTDGGYYLSAKVLELGVSYVAMRGFYGAARPHLERLAGHLDQAVTLAELVDADIVIIGRAEVPKIVAYNAALGQKLPAHATALGRVLLSGLSDEEVTRRLAMPSLAAIQPLESLKAADVAAEIVRVREQGWSLVDQTMSIGYHAIAAPITDTTGAVVAAIGIIVHGTDVNQQQLTNHHLPLLVTTAKSISEEFSHMAELPRSRATATSPSYVSFTAQSTPA